MKHLALAAALSVAMPVQAFWWDDIGQCSDVAADATRRYRVAQESHVEEMENRIKELEQINANMRRSANQLIESRDTWVDMWIDENTEKLELERRNAILQEQLDMMAAKYRPQEQTAPFNFMATPEQ